MSYTPKVDRLFDVAVELGFTEQDFADLALAAADQSGAASVASISYDDAVRALARGVLMSANTDDNDHPDNVVGRDEHALRVLIEGRLTDDVVSAVAELRKREAP